MSINILHCLFWKSQINKTIKILMYDQMTELYPQANLDQACHDHLIFQIYIFNAKVPATILQAVITDNQSRL